jgi:2-polyprenyl-6-methoxyphenol hydroxylase-like FAD-dependent oxidoreductase
VLIGADGIWSSVRSTMHGNPLRGDQSGATYSGYTVYAGELNYAAPDNGEVVGPRATPGLFKSSEVEPSRRRFKPWSVSPLGV